MFFLLAYILNIGSANCGYWMLAGGIIDGILGRRTLFNAFQYFMSLTKKRLKHR